MEEDLVAHLLADTALAALVGPRINWLKRPQADALPAISLQVASAPHTYTMKGREPLVGRLVQMDVWASTYASKTAVKRALIAALTGAKTGALRGGFLENERETTEDQDGPDASGSTTYFRHSLDVRVWAVDAS